MLELSLVNLKSFNKPKIKSFAISITKYQKEIKPGGGGGGGGGPPDFDTAFNDPLAKESVLSIGAAP